MTRTAKTLLVAIPAISALAAIAVPNFVRARVTKAKPACISQMRQIEFAKAAWAQKHSVTTNGAPAWEDLRPYFTEGLTRLICPDGGTYTIGRAGEPPACSIAEHTEYLKRHLPR